ncbi:MAG: hypothetical protein OSB75_09960, partial [Dehalococcoidia bacterium]|nr:hypothetical protein [Dehalococcoidia bacterium]
MSSTPPGLSFTARIAHWSAVHHWLILLASVIAIVLAVLSISMIGAEIRDDEGGGVGESGKGSKLMGERFAPSPSAIAEKVDRTRNEGIIFSNPSLDANDPLFEAAVNSVMA